MTFDIPFDPLLDVRSHGYINRTQENADKSVTCLAEFTEYGTSLGICCQI